MDEIKEILIILKKGQDELKFGQDELKQDVSELKQDVSELKERQERLEIRQGRLEGIQEEMREELRETNQRLAAFQEDITKKVNILLDADKARQELLEIHDAEISEISKKQFEHSTRINILEQKVG